MSAFTKFNVFFTNTQEKSQAVNFTKHTLKWFEKKICDNHKNAHLSETSHEDDPFPVVCHNESDGTLGIAEAVNSNFQPCSVHKK